MKNINEWSSVHAKHFCKEYFEKQIKETQSKYDRLEKAAMKLRDALEFYQDEDSWSPSVDTVCPAMIMGEDIRAKKNVPKRFVGGEIARCAIAEFDEAIKGDES
jgi:hypothetical protein